MIADLLRRAVARTRWWVLRERAVVAATWVAVRVLPPRPTAVVHGEPDWEGNAVEVLKGLVRRYPGQVVWLRDASTPSDAELLGDVPAGRVRAVRTRSLAALRVCARAEVTFFTHGLVTAVRPPASRLVVNLWHGDGPKATTGLPRCRSTVAVAATRLWGDYKADLFGLRPQDVAVVGNPRMDSARDRPAAQTRERLGLPAGGEQLVLWLPTFRRGGNQNVSFTNGLPLSQALEARIVVPEGVRLVVKPHPMDSDDYAGLGATVLTDRDLLRAGVTLPQLLGAADALVSDASSAWVDYLGLARPVGFFLPDLDAYGAARGYNVPDLREVLPGPVLGDPEAVSRFLLDVREGTARPPAGYPALARIGHQGAVPVTDRLFDWLDDYQSARGRRRLFTGPPSPR